MTNDPQVSAFLNDYIGLYTGATLARWEELFLPCATATAANGEEPVVAWTRDAFFARQRASFATRKPIREALEDTHWERMGRLVSVRSEFVWMDGEVSRRGQLMLLLLEEHDKLLIQALTFSYLG